MDRIRERHSPPLWELLDNITSTPPTVQQAYEVDECCLVVWLLTDTPTGPVVTQTMMACTINKLMASHFFTTSPTLCLCTSPLFLLSLRNSYPIYATVQSRLLLSLSALHNSSILGCGNNHLSDIAETPPSPSCILSPSLLSFSHFLLKPLYPTPHFSSPWGVFDSAELQVRMFRRVTQINVLSPSAQTQRSSLAPSFSTE